MAVRIPVYEDRLTPQGFGVTPQARGVEVSDAIGRSMQALGNAGQDVAGQMLREQRYQTDLLKKKQDDDAVTAVGADLANASATWPTRVDELSKATVNGGLIQQDDGSYVPMTEKLQTEFGSYRAQFLAGIKNEKARRYAEQHLNSLWSSTFRSSMAAEARLGVENRAMKVDEATNLWATAAAQNPGSIKDQLNASDTMIANSGFDEITRNRLALASRKKIVETALAAEIERNPEVARAALLAQWGIGDPGQAQAAGSSGAVTSAGNKVTRNPDGTVTLDTDPRLPAGMRNNNPGNIKWVGQSDALGPSKNKDQGDPQAVYATPEEGMAAMYRLAMKKYNGGKTTANELIAGQNGWTPGNFAAAKNIAAGMGLKPTDDLNLKDPAQLQRFARALITQEHGPSSKAYTDDMLARVAGDVLAGRKPATGTSTAPANAGPGRGGDPRAFMAGPIPDHLKTMVSMLDPERVQAFETKAQGEVNRQVAVFRSQMATTEGDHVAQYMNGQPPQRPLTEAEYTKAYGPIEGPQRFANYQAIATMGTDIQALKLQTPEQIQATVERYRPDPAKPGYELANKRFDMVVKAADAVNTARQADPMAYAQQTRIGDAKPLPFNDQAAFGAELAKRVGVANTMQQTYGAPYSLLTKAEAQTLNQGFERMTTQQRLGYLETIRKSVTDPVAYRSIMGQIAPDSPVTAMAGMILSKQSAVVVKGWTSDTVFAQRDVAAIMLEGESLLNPNKTAKGEDGRGKSFPMPKEQDMRDQFTNVVGKAFAGDANGANFAYQAVKAYYAGQSAREGDISGNINTGRLKDAINAVTGGVSDINGKGEVVRPWGMSEERFRNGAKAAFDRAIAAAGYKGSQLDVWGAYGLQTAGDGKYLLRSGTGYLTDRQGNPIVLDVSEPVSLVDQIPTGRSPLPLPPPATVKPEKMATPNTQQPKTK